MTGFEPKPEWAVPDSVYMVFLSASQVKNMQLIRKWLADGYVLIGLNADKAYFELRIPK